MYQTSQAIVAQMDAALEQAEAAYEMLIQSASGEIDLTEEQITNVLDSVRVQCAQARAAARGTRSPTPRRRLHLHGPGPTRHLHS